MDREDHNNVRKLWTQKNLSIVSYGNVTIIDRQKFSIKVRELDGIMGDFMDGSLENADYQICEIGNRLTHKSIIFSYICLLYNLSFLVLIYHQDI